MKRGLLGIVIIALLVVILWWSGQALVRSGRQSPHGVRDISKLLEKERARQGLPAIAAVVIKGDKIVAQGVVGVRKLGRPEQARLSDRWHLGSCTKSITATMIGVLVEQGKLSWNTTIAEALPDLADVMRPEYRDVTIAMLLRHAPC